MNENYLKENQKILSQLFDNSIKNHRLANAYLLYGDLNAPLKDTALYLAKSISCNNSIFACNTCPACLRFEQGRAPDSYFIDGSSETIKKEMIKDLEKHFTYSTFEKDHIACYVIHLVNNITEEAANALLKFLEEPKYEMVAFLTTNNVDSVLKTIVSRTILVKVNSVNQKEYFNTLCNLTYIKNKKEVNITTFLAYILSKITPNINEAKQIIENENIVECIETVEEFISEYSLNRKRGTYVLLSLTNKIRDNKCYNYLYLTLSTLFSDLLSDNINDDAGLKDNLLSLNISKSNISKVKTELERVNGLKQLNLNPTTVISKIIEILEEK